MCIRDSGNPAWAATSPSGPVDKAPLSELAEYLAAAVERYDGDGFQDAPGAPEVHYFELYNCLLYTSRCV